MELENTNLGDDDGEHTGDAEHRQDRAKKQKQRQPGRARSLAKPRKAKCANEGQSARAYLRRKKGCALGKGYGLQASSCKWRPPHPRGGFSLQSYSVF